MIRCHAEQSPKLAKTIKNRLQGINPKPNQTEDKLPNFFYFMLCVSVISLELPQNQENMFLILEGIRRNGAPKNDLLRHPRLPLHQMHMQTRGVQGELGKNHRRGRLFVEQEQSLPVTNAAHLVYTVQSNMSTPCRALGLWMHQVQVVSPLFGSPIKNKAKPVDTFPLSSTHCYSSP